MTTVDSRLITEPGVYDIPDDQYHADPVHGGSLSASGARKLLPPNCPAIYRYERDNPPKPKREFDIGHAAHKLILGAGPELDIIEAPDYRSSGARTLRDVAHAEGRVPVLRHEYEQVQAMAAALIAHPLAARLLDPEHGRAEQAMVWRDQRTGVWRRALVDYLPNPADGRRPIIVDYKTADNAHPDKAAKAMYDHGYYIQGATYIDGYTALGLADPGMAAFVLIVQEKTPPYLVTIAQLDHDALRLGRRRASEALDIYVRCVAMGRWPGYEDPEALGIPPVIVTLSLPPWAEKELGAHVL